MTFWVSRLAHTAENSLRQYAEIGRIATEAVATFAEDVRSEGRLPQ